MLVDEIGANFSSGTVSCTLYGCYEEEDDLSYHVLPNSSCSFQGILYIIFYHDLQLILPS